MARNLGSELRSAIQSGDFSRAGKLVTQYRDHLNRSLISADPGLRLQIVQESRQLLEESLHLARVMRAHIAAKLRATESVNCYQAQKNEDSRWSMTA